MADGYCTAKRLEAFDEVNKVMKLLDPKIFDKLCAMAVEGKCKQVAQEIEKLGFKPEQAITLRKIFADYCPDGPGVKW